MTSATTEVQSGLEGRSRVRDRDRGARPRGWRAALPRASTSRSSSATSRSARSGGCSSTASCCRGCRRPSRIALSVRSGDPRVDVQSALAMLAPQWGFGQLIDISDEEARDNLARASVMALSFVAQSARGIGKPPVSQREVDKATPNRRAVPDPLARRGQPQARRGDRRVLDLGRRARDERLDVHRARRRVDRRRRRRRAERRGRRAVRPAARRRPVRVLTDARRGRRDGRRRALRQGPARSRRPADGLRPSHLPRRGPTGAGAAADREAARTRRGSRSPRRSRRPRSPSCRRASPTACWRPTSSSGRPSCSTSPRSRRSCSRRCSRVRGRPAGRRTSWSRSARAG